MTDKRNITQEDWNVILNATWHFHTLLQYVNSDDNDDYGHLIGLFRLVIERFKNNDADLEVVLVCFPHDPKDELNYEQELKKYIISNDTGIVLSDGYNFPFETSSQPVV